MADILYIPHGGGPLPVLGDTAHEKLVRFLKEFPARIKRPDAILIISAHWEELKPMVTTARSPAQIYDYSGFPEAAYSIEYPAPGNPELAEAVVHRIKAGNMTAWRHSQRGFDHGVYIPLKIMYPDAAIPCVQVSLLSSLDPADHLQLGKTLAGLQWENLLVLGSGFSFHNMGALRMGATADSEADNDRFQEWLAETCTGPLTEAERAQRLVNWESAPAARYCHPREEHLLPLHVCCGMAQSPGELVFADTVMGQKACAFLWRKS
jgi:aromatic ring-opening dioxygenase catalytic subunit (LigB family)